MSIKHRMIFGASVFAAFVLVAYCWIAHATPAPYRCRDVSSVIDACEREGM